MRIPQITFTNNNVGFSPVQSNVRNRIGIIGQFNRGFSNVFTYLNGFSQFSNIYGSDTATGSIALQAAWDQGARDFGVIRVLGASTPAKGEFIVGGSASKENNIQLKIVGVGTPTATLGSYFRNNILVNGVYTGNTSGRYVFVVTDVTDPNAIEFKYKFVLFSEFSNVEDAINSVTQTVLDGITTAPGVTVGEGVFTLDSTLLGGDPNTTIALENGINILFGNTNEVLVFDKQDAKFTLIAEAWDYSIPVNTNDTAVEISNSITSTLAGVDPLGLIDSQLAYLPNNVNSYTNTIELNFDNDIISGAEGNQYYFYIDLDEPDGLFNIDCYYNGTTNANQLLSIDPDVANIVIGGEITVPDTSNFIIQPNSTVTNITGAGTELDPYVISTSDVGLTTVSGDITLADAEGLYVDDSTIATGLTINNYQKYTPFTQGTDGPRNSSVSLYSYTGTRLFEIQAISEGQWGNNLRLDIVPLSNSTWQLNVTDLEGGRFNPPIPSESFVIDLTQNNTVNDEGEIIELTNSNLIRGFFIPKVINPINFNVSLLTEIPSRLAPASSTTVITDEADPAHVSYFGPAKLTNISLEGGYDGPILTEQDYVNAIDLIKGEQVTFLITPGIDTSSPLVQAALVAAAEAGTEVDSLKIAVLNTRPGLKPEAAKQESLTINSTRAVMISGWATYSGQDNSAQFNCSPDALYVGLLATIGFQISPAAKSSAGSVLGISNVDNFKYLSNDNLQKYADARIEVLRPDINLGGFFFLTGNTTSSNSNWEKIVIRRTYDVIYQDLHNALQPYQSEPHTKLLRRQIETSINAYFQSLLRSAKIANVSPAVCNDSNNPPENYTTGELNASIEFLPLYAADYINITISRNTELGVQIGEA